MPSSWVRGRHRRWCWVRLALAALSVLHAIEDIEKSHLRLLALTCEAHIDASTGLPQPGRRLLQTAARRLAGIAGIAGVGDDAMSHQPIPDEQDEHRADRRADEAGALVGPVPADRLPDEGCEKSAGDSEHGREDETFRIVRAGRKKARDDARDEADQDDPDEARHDDLPR